MAINKQRIQENVDIIKKMTLEFDHYIKGYDWGGDWDMSSFMRSLNEKARNIEKELEKDDR